MNKAQYLVKNPPTNAGDPLQYSYLENLMDRGHWRAIEHGVAKNQTQMSIYTKGQGQSSIKKDD